MDRRRRILNLPELTSNLILGRVAEKRGASIHQKVRVADVLDLDRGVLSPELVSYGLRAHFDFVVGEQDGGKAFFAVEYDGPSHAWPSTQERDSKKNDICHLLHFPLLRVDSAYLRDDLGGGKSLLEWLTNLWFEYQSFLRGEHPGINHHDGRFNYGAFEVLGVSPTTQVIMKWMYEGRSFESIFETLMKLKQEEKAERTKLGLDDDLDDDDLDDDPLVFRPHDLSYLARSSLADSWDEGLVRYPAPSQVYTEQPVRGGRYARAYAVIHLPPGEGYIIGKAALRAFEFSPVKAWELVCDLAVNDAYWNHYWRWLTGLIPSSGEEQLETLKRETADWDRRMPRP